MLCPRAFVFAFAIIIAAGNIHAQTAGAGILVQDKAQESTSNLSYVFQKVTQYAEQVKQYEQMLTSVTNLKMASLLPTNNSLQQVDAGPLIQAKCNGGSSGTNLMGSITSLLSQPMDQSQQQICAQIVTTQVDKYNKTVAMLNQMNNYSSSLQTLENTVNKFSNMGESSSANTAAAGYSSQMQTDMNNWQAQMNVDDAIIKTLEGQQAILAHMALNGGSTSVIGSSGLPDNTFQNAIGSD